MNVYSTNETYKNSKAYRKLANKMAKQFGLSIEQVNKIVEKRFEQKYPTFFEDFEYKR